MQKGNAFYEISILQQAYQPQASIQQAELRSTPTLPIAQDSPAILIQSSQPYDFSVFHGIFMSQQAYQLPSSSSPVEQPLPANFIPSENLSLPSLPFSPAMEVPCLEDISNHSQSPHADLVQLIYASQ